MSPLRCKLINQKARFRGGAGEGAGEEHMRCGRSQIMSLGGRLQKRDLNDRVPMLACPAVQDIVRALLEYPGERTATGCQLIDSPRNLRIFD